MATCMFLSTLRDGSFQCSAVRSYFVHPQDVCTDGEGGKRTIVRVVVLVLVRRAPRQRCASERSCNTTPYGTRHDLYSTLAWRLLNSTRSTSPGYGVLLLLPYRQSCLRIPLGECAHCRCRSLPEIRLRRNYAALPPVCGRGSCASCLVRGQFFSTPPSLLSALQFRFPGSDDAFSIYFIQISTGRVASYAWRWTSSDHPSSAPRWRRTTSGGVSGRLPQASHLRQTGLHGGRNSTSRGGAAL
ncbi:hypothetical protein J3F83DRAFT_265921 [Trichoderma novae-zelandiae]